MKNPLVVLTKNEVLNSARKEVTKFALAHEGLFYTGGTIAFNAAGIAATYKNAPKIQTIISDTRETLKVIDDDEEKKQCIMAALRQLLPLTAPIIIFFISSTACAVIGHKKSQAKIATLTAALALAQSTISEYDIFKKEVEKEIGTEKFREIKTEAVGQNIEKDIKENNVPTKYLNTNIGSLGEVLICIPDFGIYFTGTAARIDMAFEHVNQCLSDNGKTGAYTYANENEFGGEIVFVDDLCDVLGVPGDSRPRLTKDMGWVVQEIPRIQYWIGDGHTASGIPYLTIEFANNTMPSMIEPSRFN